MKIEELNKLIESSKTITHGSRHEQTAQELIEECGE